jgi:hypothetical protein
MRAEILHILFMRMLELLRNNYEARNYNKDKIKLFTLFICSLQISCTIVVTISPFNDLA